MEHVETGQRKCNPDNESVIQTTHVVYNWSIDHKGPGDGDQRPTPTARAIGRMGILRNDRCNSEYGMSNSENGSVIRVHPEPSAGARWSINHRDPGSGGRHLNPTVIPISRMMILGAERSNAENERSNSANERTNPNSAYG